MTKGRIQDRDLQGLSNRLLCAAGADEAEAAVVAEVLVWADLVGRSSQGVWRLKEMLPRLRAGLMRSPCAAEFFQKTDSAVVVDGHDGLGRYIGQIAMAKAVGLARGHGVGIAAVRNSSHYGAAAYYTQIAAREGMLGLALTNTPRRVAAHGGTTPLFGTNPFAFGAPLRHGDSVLIDFSTSAMAGSVIRKGAEASTAMPEGVAVDERGQTVTDPKRAQGFAILPFGGAKGYCMGLFVEILSSVITGSLMSFQIPSMLEKSQPATRIGHFFLAIDIAKLLPLDDYYDRMESLVAVVKNSPRQEGVDEVLIPGEARWRNYTAQKKEGVLLDETTIASLTSLAAAANLPTPW